MSAAKRLIADCLDVTGRFRRSAHLEKDYSNFSQNGEYIITPTTREALRRLAEGLPKNSTSRAWTLTGPYGVGKSAFAVFLTRFLCSEGETGKKARGQIKEADPLLHEQMVDLGMTRGNAKRFLPILITSRRAPAPQCLTEGIIAAATGAKNREISNSVRKLKAVLHKRDNGQSLDTKEVVGALMVLAKASMNSGYAGVLLAIDELGKLFEYAARYPQKGDVFVLQEIAEQAARSSAVPILLVGLLHQSFEEYGQHLDLATRREWAKIQGRFEDIAFIEPADQVIRIIAKAIRWKPGAMPQRLATRLKEIASAACRIAINPPGMRESDFIEIAQAAYPLHPTTLVALPFIFRRFAQNERSLFSYLNSHEPHGFQEFIKNRTLSAEEPFFVRLSDLFDYFTSNFGAGLYRHPHALRWMEAADVLDRKANLANLDRATVKTIGVLNALGEFCHLGAKEQIVSLAITDSLATDAPLRHTLRNLKEQSILTYRKFNDTYRIWEGSDVDIEERIAEGERKIRHNLGLGDSVKRYLPARPLVARRHSFETGALRYFAVEYVDAPDEVPARTDAADSDGKVLVCLGESTTISEQFRQCALKACHSQNVLFAIPLQIGELRSAVTMLGALRWAWDNTPELRDDRVARREISLRIAEANQLLLRNLDNLLDPRDEPLGSGCLWIHKGRRVEVRSPVEVSQLLSDVCDQVYPATPHIRNELITRRALSSAAAAARRNLVERMLTRHAEETLGMEGYPPERSMYESVLRATGLHRQDKEGGWKFCAPGRKDPKNISPSWNRMYDLVFGRQPEPLAVNEIFAALSSSPYGVLDGLHPVLLCAFMLAYPDETTLYREGTFVPEPTVADFEVLMRRPELFALAGSRVSGARALVVQRMAKGLKVNAATVPVVRVLFSMVKGFPEFARITRRLPEATLALREAFQNAKSPEQFLFVRLPQALGLLPFSEQKPKHSEVDRFFDLLNANLRDWSEATARVVTAARDALLKACGLGSGESEWNELRHIAVSLESTVTEPQLLAFVRRVAEAGADASGVESVLALVASRPPSNWTDADVDRFPDAAAVLGRSLRDAVRMAEQTATSESQMRQLSPKERKQAEAVLGGVRRYLKRTTKETPPHVIRAAMKRLMEEFQG